MQYVRSRHGDLQSDFGRSQRQQQVLQAIRQKANQVSPEDLPGLSDALKGELKTSIGLSRVAALLPLAASLNNPDSIRQVILLPPYTHGGGPGGSVTASWGLIWPLVHSIFP
jgi:anionic cell wall polymer biosynthesis LytR-Cps2A-Psr (LCP) family protein